MPELFKFILFDLSLPAIVAIIGFFLSNDRHERWLALLAGLLAVAISLGAQLLVQADETEQSVAEIRHGANYAKALQQSEPLVTALAEDTKARFERQMQKLANGELEINAEQDLCSVPVLAIGNADHEVRATSMVEASTFWLASCGDRYALANKAALKRGVNIHRVFLLSPAQLQAPGSKRVSSSTWRCRTGPRRERFLSASHASRP